MPWTQAEIESKHPELYHVTFPENGERIRRLGLFSAATNRKQTSAGKHADLDLLRVGRTVIHCGREEIILNDQIPMLGVLDRCKLPTGMNSQAWVNYLDEHVFFWASKGRLLTFLLARAARNRTKRHSGLYESVVFRMQTKSLFENVGDGSTYITMQNSGAPDRQKTERHRFTLVSRRCDVDTSSVPHWYDKEGKRKSVVEVATKQHISASLLEVMPQDELTDLLESALCKKENKRNR